MDTNANIEVRGLCYMVYTSKPLQQKPLLVSSESESRICNMRYFNCFLQIDMNEQFPSNLFLIAIYSGFDTVCEIVRFRTVVVVNFK